MSQPSLKSQAAQGPHHGTQTSSVVGEVDRVSPGKSKATQPGAIGMLSLLSLIPGPGVNAGSTCWTALAPGMALPDKGHPPCILLPQVQKPTVPSPNPGTL